MGSPHHSRSRRTPKASVSQTQCSQKKGGEKGKRDGPFAVWRIEVGDSDRDFSTQSSQPSTVSNLIKQDGTTTTKKKTAEENKRGTWVAQT